MYELNKGRSSLISNTQFNINFKPKKDFIGMDYGLNKRKIYHIKTKKKKKSYKKKLAFIMSGLFHGPLLDLRHPPSVEQVHEPPKKSGN
jgi:hypothetical protein